MANILGQSAESRRTGLKRPCMAYRLISATRVHQASCRRRFESAQELRQLEHLVASLRKVVFRGAGHGVPYLLFHVHDQERSDVGHALAVPDVDIEDAVCFQDVGQRLLSAGREEEGQSSRMNASGDSTEN